jgi:ferredoxin
MPFVTGSAANAREVTPGFVSWQPARYRSVGVRFIDAAGESSQMIGAGVSPEGFTIVFEPSGRRFDAPAGVPLLQAARAAGLILPSTCRNGTCRSCICRLVSGRVRYAIEWPGLSAQEKAEGFILPCVAIPESALVVEAARVAALEDPG